MKLAVALIGLLVANGARADEQKIKVKDLPKPVVAAVKARYPEAKITEAAREEEDGKTIYEVEIKDHDETLDLAYSAKGKLLEITKEIAAKQLPKAVRAALAAKYPKAKIKEVEEVVSFEDDEEEKTFEVVMAIEGEEDVEVSLSPEGKILEDDDEDDNDKKDKKDKKEKDGDEDDKKESKGKSKPKGKD